MYFGTRNSVTAGVLPMEEQTSTVLLGQKRDGLRQFALHRSKHAFNFIFSVNAV